MSEQETDQSQQFRYHFIGIRRSHPTSGSVEPCFIDVEEKNYKFFDPESFKSALLVEGSSLQKAEFEKALKQLEGDQLQVAMRRKDIINDFLVSRNGYPALPDDLVLAGIVSDDSVPSVNGTGIIPSPRHNLVPWLSDIKTEVLKYLRQTQGVITVRLTPKSSQDKTGEFKDGILKVHVRAVPEDGKANDALIRVLSDYLSVPKTSITLVRGHKGRIKNLSISMD